MKFNDLPSLLDRLATLRARLDGLGAEKAQAIDRLLTPEQRAQVAAIVGEFTDLWASLTSDAAQLEAEIRAAVLAGQCSARGQQLWALYSSGRVQWDTRGLDGYALAHPEVAKFRKVGQPSVTIRAAQTLFAAVSPEAP